MHLWSPSRGDGQLQSANSGTDTRRGHFQAFIQVASYHFLRTTCLSRFVERQTFPRVQIFSCLQLLRKTTQFYLRLRWALDQRRMVLIAIATTGSLHSEVQLD